MKICFLVLTHKPIEYILKLASDNPEFKFYVHYDQKSDINKISVRAINNVSFIEQREDVKWAGFSMVRATLNLIKFALADSKENEFFHLLSGDDVLLTKQLSWNDHTIFMECIDSLRHNYRTRFFAPHADTKYTRSFLGKVLTQIYKLIDKTFPQKRKAYKFGSQWFSIRRGELELMMNSITQEDIDFFRKKLCPDEHFFQYLIMKNNLLSKISSEGNKRNIVFDQNFQRGSSPIFLSKTQLVDAKKSGFWFSRKVKPEVMDEFYQYLKDE